MKVVNTVKDTTHNQIAPSRLFVILKHVLKDKYALFGVVVLSIFIIIALLADVIAPYEPSEMVRDSQGHIKKLQRPSKEHLFGTTNVGRDIFSQVIKGSQPAMFVGMMTAILVTVIGATVGVVSGYVGGMVDTILMRIVDVFYAIPFIPFMIVLVTLTKPSIWNIIIGITLLSWRTVARVIRSQVLSISKRPFIKSAIVAGCSHSRIMLHYILPSVLPLVLLEMAFMVNSSIMAEASISFLGLGDPDLVSWGQILHTNFLTGHSHTAWWWIIPPGLAIVLLLLSIFFITRSVEELLNPRLKHER